MNISLTAILINGFYYKLFPGKLRELTVLNIFKKNFSTKLYGWKKEFKLSKIIADKWILDYRGLM